MSRLTQIYEELKAEINLNPSPASNFMNVQSVGNLKHSPGALSWRNMAAKEAEKLSEACAKRILLDNYCKIIPLDSDFICSNKSLMKSDVNSFLANKGINATQYFKSCHEKTKAPDFPLETILLVYYYIININTKPCDHCSHRVSLAEGKRFELLCPCGQTVFKN